METSSNHSVKTILNDDINNEMQCVHELFYDRVKLHPNKCCLVLDDRSLSYSEVAQAVHDLSLVLINDLHVRVGDIVCQCFERSLEMIISLLAIVSVGGVYCPLNPNDPSKRLRMLMTETRAKLVLVHTMTADKFDKDKCVVNVEQYIFPQTQVNNRNALTSRIDITVEHHLYAIFTSGSTGKPKCVSNADL